MKSDVQKLMQKFKDTDIPIIEAAFVKVYLQKKNIFFENSRFICSYLERVADRDAELYRYIFDSFHFGQIDDLIGIFEHLLNSENKKMNGMIYTPYHIKNILLNM